MRRSLLLAAVGAALALPAAASAAPTVVGSVAPGAPQDCQAGCIGSLKFQCAAADALAVRTTVSCWTNPNNKLTSFQDLPAAFVTGTQYSGVLASFTFCVQGTARYANGTTATTLKCAAGDGAAFVAG
jgi:hypothetical protein